MTDKQLISDEVFEGAWEWNELGHPDVAVLTIICSLLKDILETLKKISVSLDRSPGPGH